VAEVKGSCQEIRMKSWMVSGVLLLFVWLFLVVVQVSVVDGSADGGGYLTCCVSRFTGLGRAVSV
jgi:hypothetical protein